MKAHGVAGRAKALPASAAAKRWGIPIRDVEQLIEAAIGNGALKIDGTEWVITGWKKYQPFDDTAAERMKRHREKSRSSKGQKAPLRRTSVTLHPVPSRDSDVDVDSDRDRTAGEHARASSAAPQVNGRSTEPPEATTVAGFVPLGVHHDRAIALGLSIPHELNRWRLHRRANGIEPADVDADFLLWLERAPEFNGNSNGGHPESPARVSPPVYVPPREDGPLVGPTEIRKLTDELRQKALETPDPRRRPPLSRDEGIAYTRSGKIPGAEP